MKIEYNIEELLKIVDVQLQQEQRECDKKLKEWEDEKAEINIYNDERLSEAHEILSDTTVEGLLAPYVIHEKKTKKVKGWIFSRDISWEEVTVDVDRFAEDYPVFTFINPRQLSPYITNNVELLGSWEGHTQRLIWEDCVREYPLVVYLGVTTKPLKPLTFSAKKLESLRQLHTRLTQLKKMSDSSLTGSVVTLEDSEIELLFK